MVTKNRILLKMDLLFIDKKINPKVMSNVWKLNKIKVLYTVDIILILSLRLRDKKEKIKNQMMKIKKSKIEKFNIFFWLYKYDT